MAAPLLEVSKEAQDNETLEKCWRGALYAGPEGADGERGQGLCDVRAQAQRCAIRQRGTSLYPRAQAQRSAIHERIPNHA